MEGKRVFSWFKWFFHPIPMIDLAKTCWGIQELQLRDAAMTATGSIQRKRYSNRSNNQAGENPGCLLKEEVELEFILFMQHLFEKNS